MLRTYSMDAVRCATAAALLIAPLSAGGEKSPYLPRVGPGGLRLKAHPVVEVKYRLRPLDMGLQGVPEETPKVGEVRQTTEAPAIPRQTIVSTGEMTTMTTAPGMSSPVQQNEPQTGINEVDAQEFVNSGASGSQSMVTPQMFLRFFNREGTRETTVMAPFTVPKGGAKESSTATYISQ